MNKAMEFVKEERDTYGKTYVDINYAIDDISPFISTDKLNTRKYFIKLSVLKKYIELLETSKREINKNGFTGFFKNDKYVNLLNSYKSDHLKELNQLQKCKSCKCLNCTAECKFDSCLGCREKSYITQCDHKKLNITLHDGFILSLTNNDTGLEDRYSVLAVLQDSTKDLKYIILKNIHSDEKLILYYYPGIKEDTYGEIQNEEEFDYIAGVFESIAP